MRNFRELDYSPLRPGLLFRSESLHHLSRKDQKMLQEKGIRYVIDLRTNEERKAKKDAKIEGIENIALPMITMQEMGVGSEKELKTNLVKNHILPDIYDYYRHLVRRERKPVWSKIFSLMEESEGGILVHCTVGKDRSGTVAAMMMKALGVDEETIYRDYLLTNDHPIIPLSYRLYAKLLDKKFRKEFMEYFAAKKEYLDAAFDEINVVYGSFDAFLKECCDVDEEKLSALRRKYLKTE